MARFIVTGAGGYLGSAVIRALTAEGDEVISVSRSAIEPELRSQVLREITCDLWEFLGHPDFPSIIADSIVIHLAWEDGFVHNSDKHMLALSSHFRFFLQCIQAGAQRFVSTGTMHEIGSVEGEINEECRTNPVTQYGIAKNALRASILELSARLEFSSLWLRCFYITGRDERNHSVFTRILELDRAGEPFVPLTTGQAVFDFIDVDELGRQIVAVARRPEITGLLNLGSGQLSSLRERIESFKRVNNLTIELRFGAFKERAGITLGAWPNLSRTRALIPELVQSAY